jgi:homocysteine S-methyltransferase
MTRTHRVDDRLARGEVVLLDGGMGTELEARGVPMDDDVWSGAANLTHADVVQAIHEDSIAAGADVVIANSFAAAPWALASAGLGDRVAEVNERAVEAALRARAASGRDDVLVAGSLSSAEGIRSRPPSATELREGYAAQAVMLAEAGVDLFVLEMITSARHGVPALEAAFATGLPVWLGVSAAVAADGRVTAFERDDAPLDDLLRELLTPELAAVNVMHSEVTAVIPAAEVVRARWSGPIGAYPHVGDWTPPNWVFHPIEPDAYASAAAEWVEHGVQIVGGCCGIAPVHIAAVKARLAG